MSLIILVVHFTYMGQVCAQQGGGPRGGGQSVLGPLSAGGCVRLPGVRCLHEALQPDPGHPARGLPAGGQWTGRCHHPSQPGHGEAC